MKKIITTIVISISFSTFSQIPNWTETSCNGNNYEMYNELANGNVVILDFSAIWCTPCTIITPELQTIWENYGEGTLGVMVFDFLTQDQSTNEADCLDMDFWESNLSLTYPGFANPNVNSIYTEYNSLYGNSSIPLILIFIPNVNDPGASELVYNYAEDLSSSSGDISDDIMAVLTENGYWALGMAELNTGKSKEVVQIIDLLGRETVFKANTPLIYIYNDGTRERVMKIEY